MSDNIKVGDLVYVAKPMPCCGSTHSMGYVFRVQEIITLPFAVSCKFCEADIEDSTSAVCEQRIGHSIFRLRKFDPLSDPTEAERTAEREKADECPYV